jgi:predicted nucleotidyltransferase component of viral defense system
VPPLAPIQVVEAFHLIFLRALEAKVDRSFYVVKGGVNLRAWFGSSRYSEDLDVDVLRLEVFELADKVDAVLRAPVMQSLLVAQQLAVVRTSKPKQTGTTQRWKFELQVRGQAHTLHTKIEFSRRGAEDEYSLQPVLAEIVRPYGIPAPTANHYTAAAATRQKIQALAGRRQAQARDIWDLEHLLRACAAAPKPFAASDARVLELAIERAVAMPYETFKSQVVSFLAPEHQDLHGTQIAWQRIQDLVVQRLMELRP